MYNYTQHSCHRQCTYMPTQNCIKSERIYVHVYSKLCYFAKNVGYTLKLCYIADIQTFTKLDYIANNVLHASSKLCYLCYIADNVHTPN